MEITLDCKVCGQAFIWSDGEQQFYKDRNLQPPRRCPGCRRVKREEKSREVKSGELLQS